MTWSTGQASSRSWAGTTMCRRPGRLAPNPWRAVCRFHANLTRPQVTPQVLINQNNTLTANNVFEVVTNGSAAVFFVTFGDESTSSEQSPPPMTRATYTKCSNAGASQGPRSRGFLIPIETLFATTLTKGGGPEIKLALASGQGARSDAAGSIVAAVAAEYGFVGSVHPDQMYGAAYAVLGIDDFVAHNHAGAGTLFPDQAVLGSRPRIDDLVGNMDTEDTDIRKSMTGSCGQINDMPAPGTRTGFLAEGGKASNLPLNSADGICAVFSGTACGDPSFAADGSFGKDQWNHLDSVFYHQFVNQYNLPGFQMSLAGGDDDISTKIPRPPNAVPEPTAYNSQLNAENDCWAHLSVGGCGNNGAWSALPDCARDSFGSPGGDFHCFGGADGGNYVADNPACDPRQYGIDLNGGQKGCTNARARFKASSDYSVSPSSGSADGGADCSGAGVALCGHWRRQLLNLWDCVWNGSANRALCEQQVQRGVPAKGGQVRGIYRQ